MKDKGEAKPKRRLGWIVVVMVLVWLAIGFSSWKLLVLNDMECMASGTCEKVGAVVVISGGDTEARVRGAIEVYKKGVTDLIIVSGAAADKKWESNAAMMKRQAVVAGVPEDRIIMDERAENTYENAENVAGIVRSLELEEIVLVTSGYHQRRAYLEFRGALGGEVEIRNYSAPGEDCLNWWWWLTPTGVFTAVKEWAGAGLTHAR